MAKTSSRKAKADDESTSELSASIFRESLTAILGEIRGIVAGTIKPKEHDATSRVAWLARQAAGVAAEQRKAEKAELDSIRKLSAAVVMTWIKLQPAETRARIVREVTAMDARERKSVLG